jgi:hypothetical protein
VNSKSASINIALRVDVVMKSSVCEATINDFNATNFNDAITSGWI